MRVALGRKIPFLIANALKPNRWRNRVADRGTAVGCIFYAIFISATAENPHGFSCYITENS